MTAEGSLTTGDRTIVPMKDRDPGPTIDITKGERPPKAPPPSKPSYRYFTKDGTLVPGVTTALGVLAKPALIKWANNMGLKGIDTTKYTDEKASIGTLTHYAIECELRGLTPDTSGFTEEQIKAARIAYSHFADWQKRHSLVPHRQDGKIVGCELELVSESYLYGGTCDFYGLLDGEPALIDFKTSGAIYDEHLIQVSAYRALLLEHGFPVSRTLILRVGRTPQEGFDVKEITDLRWHWAIFTHLLAVYRLQKQMKGENIKKEPYPWLPTRNEQSAGA